MFLESLSSAKGDKVAPEPAASRAPSRAASTRSKQEPKAVQATFESSGEEAPATRKVEKGKVSLTMYICYSPCSQAVIL